MVSFDLGGEQGAHVMGSQKASRQLNGRHGASSRQRGWAPTQRLEAGGTADC